MTSHYTWGSTTTLHDFGGVLGRPLDTFFWAFTISWSRLLARVWSGPKQLAIGQSFGQCLGQPFLSGYYTKYDILCNMLLYVTVVTFQMTLLMNKWTNIVMEDEWVHPLAKTLPSLVNNLWWNIVMDDWILDEKLLGKWQWLQHCKSIITQKI